MYSKFKVYLSGPISGLTFGEAIGWTDYAKTALELASGGQIVGYKPLRGKDFLKNEQSLNPQGYNHNPVSKSKSILQRDEYDVRSSDLILVNLMGAKEKSLGTTAEIAFAHILNKPIILVMEPEGNCHHHAFITEMAGVWYHDLDAAIDYVVGQLLP